MAEEKITITELEPEELKSSVPTPSMVTEPTISPTTKKVAGVTAAGMLIGTAMIMATDPTPDTKIPEPTAIVEQYNPSSPIQEEYNPDVALSDTDRDVPMEEAQDVIPETIEEAKPQIAEAKPVKPKKETFSAKVKKLFTPKAKKQVVQKPEPKKKYTEPKEDKYTVSKKDTTTHYKKPIPWEKLQSIRFGWDGGHIHPEGIGANFERKKNLDS
jgi:hypothetical protein